MGVLRLVHHPSNLSWKSTMVTLTSHWGNFIPLSTYMAKYYVNIIPPSRFLCCNREEERPDEENTAVLSLWRMNRLDPVSGRLRTATICMYQCLMWS